MWSAVKLSSLFSGGFREFFPALHYFYNNMKRLICVLFVSSFICATTKAQPPYVPPFDSSGRGYVTPLITSNTIVNALGYVPSSGGGAATNIGLASKNSYINVSTNGTGDFRVEFNTNTLQTSSNRYVGSYTGDGNNLTNLNIPQGSVGNVSLTNSAVYYAYSDGTAWGNHGPISTAGTRTSGLQEIVDSIARVNSVVAGQSVVKIICGGSGTTPFTLTTNVVWPNYYAFNIELDCAGSVFILKNTHQDKSKGYFSGATNYVNGLTLTNSLRLEIHHGLFAQEDDTSTNAIFGEYGWLNIHDNTITTLDVLTNGNGGYTLNWDNSNQSFPSHPLGVVGIMHDTDWTGTGTGANGQLRAYRNNFYGLACAIASGSIVNYIEENYFSWIGCYESAGSIKIATNLWVGDIGGAPTPMSSGATIVGTGLNDNSWIQNNIFYVCGLCVFGGPNRWLNNHYSVVGYRMGDSADYPASIPSIQELQPDAGYNAATIPPDDVQLTNNPSNTKMSVDGGHLMDASRRAHSGLSVSPTMFIQYNSGSVAYFGFSGGPIIATNGITAAGGVFTGNASGLTNLVNAPVTIAGTNITVQTNTIAGTGQKTYTINASGTNYVTITNTVGGANPLFIGAYVGTDQLLTKSTATLQNITELSKSITAGKWAFHCVVGWTNTTTSPTGGGAALGITATGGGSIGTVRLSALSYQVTSSASVNLGTGYSSSTLYPPLNGSLPGGSHDNIMLDGVIQVTADGTFTVQIKIPDASAEQYIVEKNSYFTLCKM